MLMKFLSKLRRDERGVSALEYAILAAVIVGAVVVGVTAFEGGLEAAFTELGSQLTEKITSSFTN